MSKALIKLTIPLLFLLFISLKIVSAQVMFQKAYYGAHQNLINSIEQTTDGGFIIAGTINNACSNLDQISLIKTDTHGDTLWTKYIGTIAYDACEDVHQTTDGGYIICGHTNCCLGSGDVLLIKTNSLGDVLWVKTIGESATYEDGKSIQQTSDSGYIITGTSNTYDVYLVKTNSIGDTLWARTFANSITTEFGNCVRQTSDGGYVILGQTQYFLNSDIDVYIIKTNANGDTLWTKTYGGNGDDIGTSIQKTIDEGFIIGGYTNSFGVGDFDAYVLKIDSTGNIIWQKTYGTGGIEKCYYVAATQDSGYIIAGGMINTLGFGIPYLIKLNSFGDTLWSKTYGSTGANFYGNKVSCEYTSDHGFALANWTNGFGIGGLGGIYLIKTDSIGTSGCYEQNLTLSITTPLTQIRHHYINVASNHPIVNSPSTPICQGLTVLPLCISVNVSEYIANMNPILVFPNPIAGNGIIKISMDEDISQGKINLFNEMGEKVYSSSFIGQEKLIPCNLSNGIYFIEITDSKNIWTQKIIKQ